MAPDRPRDAKSPLARIRDVSPEGHVKIDMQDVMYPAQSTAGRPADYSNSAGSPGGLPGRGTCRTTRRTCALCEHDPVTDRRPLAHATDHVQRLLPLRLRHGMLRSAIIRT
jgi:hypothetical protein